MRVDGDPPQRPLALDVSNGNSFNALSTLEIDRLALHRRLEQIQGAAALPLPS